VKERSQSKVAKVLLVLRFVWLLATLLSFPFFSTSLSGSYCGSWIIAGKRREEGNNPLKGPEENMTDSVRLLQRSSSSNSAFTPARNRKGRRNTEVGRGNRL